MKIVTLISMPVEPSRGKVMKSFWEITMYIGYTFTFSHYTALLQYDYVSYFTNEWMEEWYCEFTRRWTMMNHDILFTSSPSVVKDVIIIVPKKYINKFGAYYFITIGIIYRNVRLRYRQSFRRLKLSRIQNIFNCFYHLIMCTNSGNSIRSDPFNASHLLFMIALTFLKIFLFHNNLSRFKTTFLEKNYIFCIFGN